jgi:hypothetical protein
LTREEDDMRAASAGWIVWTTLALVVAAGAAGAEEGPGNGKSGGKPSACRQDRERLCPSARGGNEIFQCLKTHEADLSQGCRDQMKVRRQHFEARLKSAQQACEGDIERHCAGVDPGDRRLLQCLRKHESELTNECRSSLPQRRRPKTQKQSPPPPEP